MGFDYMKATQALNYFAQKEGGNINRMKALKLIYLADRYHLRKYGRLITNDEYFAMQLGPVASQTADIAEESSFMGDEERVYHTPFVRTKGQYSIESLCAPDLEVFSNSDVEALDFAWTELGGLQKFDASDITHYYPEWFKHKEKLKNSKRVPMDFNDFLDDPIRRDINKCFELSEDEKGLRRDQIKEMNYLEALWV